VNTLSWLLWLALLTTALFAIWLTMKPAPVVF
jgi:hypothetical protein